MSRWCVRGGFQARNRTKTTHPKTVRNSRYDMRKMDLPQIHIELERMQVPKEDYEHLTRWQKIGLIKQVRALCA